MDSALHCLLAPMPRCLVPPRSCEEENRGPRGVTTGGQRSRIISERAAPELPRGTLNLCVCMRYFCSCCCEYNEIYGHVCPWLESQSNWGYACPTLSQCVSVWAINYSRSSSKCNSKGQSPANHSLYEHTMVKVRSDYVVGRYLDTPSTDTGR